jgi:hypothetical protein
VGYRLRANRILLAVDLGQARRAPTSDELRN